MMPHNRDMYHNTNRICVAQVAARSVSFKHTHTKTHIHTNTCFVCRTWYLLEFRKGCGLKRRRASGRSGANALQVSGRVLQPQAATGSPSPSEMPRDKCQLARPPANARKSGVAESQGCNVPELEVAQALQPTRGKHSRVWLPARRRAKGPMKAY